MKKSIFVILIFIIVLPTLWVLITKDIPSNVNGITLSLNNSRISIDNPILEIEVENTNNYEATYGSEWRIERYVNGIWKKVFPTGVASFTTELLSVPSHQSKTETVNLESYLKDKLIVGKYRISKKIEIEQAKHRLGVTFEIK